MKNSPFLEGAIFFIKDADQMAGGSMTHGFSGKKEKKGVCR